MGYFTIDDIMEWESKGKAKKLIQELGDDDMQDYAAESLARIGEPAIMPLVSCLKDENAVTRMYDKDALATNHARAEPERRHRQGDGGCLGIHWGVVALTIAPSDG